jgi:hypothetical protein
MKLLLLIATLSPAALAQVRVEPRLLVKEGQLFISGGATWLARNDYYSSPGITLSAIYYAGEDNGVELRTALFASWLDDSAKEVFGATGLKPDAQKPVALLLGGWRHSLAYGKVAVGSGVVHFDVQSGLYAGTLITDAAATPALAASVGVIARLGRRGFAQLDFSLLASREQRSTAVLTLGVLPGLTFGFSL